MDQEFIKNIMGSPFVNEGGFDRLKARASQAVFKGTSQFGGGSEDPKVVKIKSLWDGFLKKLRPIMDDWNNVQKPNVTTRTRITLTPEQESIVSALDGIYDSVKVSPLVGASLRKPSPQYPAGAYNLRSAVSEAVFKPSDPNGLLQYVKNKVVNLYNTFIADVSKTTGIPKNNVENEISQIQLKGVKQPTSGYIPSGTISNVVSKLKSLVSADQATDPSTAAPSTPDATSSTEVPPSPEPPKDTAAETPKEPSTEPSKQPTDKPSTQTAGGEPMGTDNGTDATTHNDFAALILEVIKIIIKTVSADTTHADPVMKAQKLPQSYDEPQIAEATAGEDAGDEDTGEDAGDEDTSDEMPGAFVYNFWSRYRKQPGSFSIDVGDEQLITLPSGKQKRIQVKWHSHDGQNDIWVFSKGDDGQLKKSLVFKIYDDQAKPQHGWESKVDANFLLGQSQPMGGPQLDKSKIDPKIVSELDANKTLLFRALFATIRRKGMEFSRSKKQGFLKLKAYPDGSVHILDRDNNPTGPKISKNSVYQKLYSDERDKWIYSLDKINYFDTHEKPKMSYEYDSFKDAELSLIKLGTKKAEASILVKDAWYKLIGPPNNKIPNEITAEELVKMVQKESPSTFGSTQSTPAPATQSQSGVDVNNPSEWLKGLPFEGSLFKDVMMEVMKKVNLDQSDAFKVTKLAWDELLKDHKPYEINKTKLYQTTLNLHKSTQTSNPAPDTTSSGSEKQPQSGADVSKPASGSEVSSPAGGATVSKPAGDTDVSKSAGGAVVSKSSTEQPKKPRKSKTVDIGSIKQLDNGELEFIHPKTKSVMQWDKDQVIQAMKKSPHFVKALDAAGLTKFYTDYANSKKPTNETYTRHGLINPWNKSNFLY